MELGSFSISLVVKDLAVSKDFYEKLGFTIFGGVQTQNCLILKNGAHTIGFFKECLKIISSLLFLDGMGWDADAKEIDSFTDVREIQRQLKESGIEFAVEADENSDGPASFMIKDPDGNTILIDQHR